MPPYDPNPEIIGLSSNELRIIMQWVGERENSLSRPITVIIGGWAVHAYNPWLGSVDIDLVTNSDTRHSLMHYLINVHKYEHHQIPLFDINSVLKNTTSGDIIIDFMSRSDRHFFAGSKKDELNFDCLNDPGFIRKMPIGGGIYAHIPERTALLLFKIKASWDRFYRYTHGMSFDPAREYGKFIKDNGDILALLDQDCGGSEINLSYLGNKLDEYAFLKAHLKYISDNVNELSDYKKMDKNMARGTIDRLLNLI